MATPVEPAATPAEPQGSAPAASPAPESTPPVPQAPAGSENPPEANDGLPRTMPDGVTVSGRKGGQPEPAAQTPAEPADPPSPQAQPEADPAKAKRPEVSDLPDWAQKLIKDAREDAAKARTTAKQQAADEAAAAATKKVTEDIGRALGLITDDAPAEEQLTPEQLQELLGNERKSTKQAKTELAVFKAAQNGGFNVAALLDSKSFLDSLADVNPSDSEAVAGAINAALEANSWLRTQAAPAATDENPAPAAPVAPAVPATPSGGSFAGGPGARSQDASTMTIDDFRALRRGK